MILLVNTFPAQNKKGLRIIEGLFVGVDGFEPPTLCL
jgi:hypothetical protein